MQVNLQIANLYFSKGKEEKVPQWLSKQLILMIDIIKQLLLSYYYYSFIQFEIIYLFQNGVK